MRLFRFDAIIENTGHIMIINKIGVVNEEGEKQATNQDIYTIFFSSEKS